MKLEIDNKFYDVIITRKNIKNMYLRVKEDLKIYVTVSYLVRDKQVIKFIKENINSIINMINKQIKKAENNNKILFLGKELNLIISANINKPYLNNNNLYIKDKEDIKKFYRKEAQKIFNERLIICLNDFNDIPKFTLRIREMKTRWGVNNLKSKTITLNLNLIKYNYSEIDYVIIHELCHFYEFNHSRRFWNLVEYYKKEYKSNRKVLKE